MFVSVFLSTHTHHTVGGVRSPVINKILECYTDKKTQKTRNEMNNEINRRKNNYIVENNEKY